MGLIEGERSVEIDAPIARCYEIAADIENACLLYTSPSPRDRS